MEECCLPACLSWLAQLSSSEYTPDPPAQGWQYPQWVHQLTIKENAPQTATSQSDEINFPTEMPFSQMNVICVKLTETMSGAA